MIRFIHCADLHLGRSFKTALDMNEKFTEEAVESAYTSFKAIVQEAIKRKTDFIIVSGDIYDQKDRAIRAQWFFKKQAELLKANNIPLFVIHGNHDPVFGNKEMVEMPDNVHIFSTEVSHTVCHTAGGEKAVIYGFSYPQAAYTENPLPFYNKIDDEDAYHIGMLHGQEQGQEGHDPYAPFTLKELVEKSFNYWALGHVHKQQILKKDPAVVYPGNIQGAHRKEEGPKGAMYVELSKQKTHLEFIDTAPVRWENIRVPIDGLRNIDHLTEAINNQIDRLPDHKKYVLVLHITGVGDLHDQLSDKKSREEVVAFLNEEYSSEKTWVDRVKVRSSPPLKKDQWKTQDNLLGDVVRTGDSLKYDGEWTNILSPLTDHRKIRPFIDEITGELEEEIIEKAETLILSALLEEREY
ncbi:metallophosphoesterase family protein [Salipaludibacillus aurantiacus]|uniref:DNA repair exonuclease SbcCD nuclease subunit n=1 Tax=Salipaludibacillus aurantiacus TaxID=1601833 RepID=A0A1H9RQE4_9BACI|nr:DNA repair exonuclease [Salipaludibacillus aurantiacus]SER74109.1 DNA repair exonuclease SbcCD nuclease subunit [Salipaludibacillus aurantiacus]